MNFGIELSFFLLRIYSVLIYKNPNPNLILSRYPVAINPHDLSLTFSSFLSVASISFLSNWISKQSYPHIISASNWMGR